MKKILLIAFLGTLFASVSAFAHCGSCGTGDAAHEHGEKACCSENGCCKDKAKDGTKAACAENCEKACCKKAEETAAAPAAGACCAKDSSKAA